MRMNVFGVYLNPPTVVVAAAAAAAAAVVVVVVCVTLCHVSHAVIWSFHARRQYLQQHSG